MTTDEKLGFMNDLFNFKAGDVVAIRDAHAHGDGDKRGVVLARCVEQFGDAVILSYCVRTQSYMSVNKDQVRMYEFELESLPAK